MLRKASARSTCITSLKFSTVLFQIGAIGRVAPSGSLCPFKIARSRIGRLLNIFVAVVVDLVGKTELEEQTVRQAHANPK
jgi:hypothetical protein